MDTELSQPEQVALWDRRARMPDTLREEPDPELVSRLGRLDAQHRQALDIGCGCGRNLLYMARQGWRVTGLDWSGEALTQAKHLLDRHEQVATYVKGDFRRIPIDSGRFSLVVAVGTLQHARSADFRRTMVEIKRLLRPGGTAIVSVPAVSNAPPPHVGIILEEGTVVLDSGVEAGIPHHFFREAELEAAFRIFPRGAEIDLLRRPFPRGYTALSSEQQNDWYWITAVA